MDSTTHIDEVAVDFSPMLKIYKSGRVERLLGTSIVPPSVDPTTGVDSKDVIIDPETGLSARLYIPKSHDPAQKLPLLIYIHGGGFCIETASSPTYHNYLNALVAEANVIAVSVDYRRAPEHRLPVAYDDSWTAVKWVGSNFDDWVKSYADFDRVFFAGDSAGANIVHNMGLRIGGEEVKGIKLRGIVLLHPYFWGKEPVGGEPVEVAARAIPEGLWKFSYPDTSGADDPLINPAMDENLAKLGCGNVMVVVSEKDILRDRGWYYYEKLGKCGWNGVVDIVEQGEGHVFHLLNPGCNEAKDLLKKVATYLNQS